MPVNFNKAQQDAISSGFLDKSGQGGYVEFKVVSNILGQYEVEFLKNVENTIKKKQVVSSGYLGSNIKTEIVQESNGSTSLLVKVPDYYDYPNKGVKGVKSSKNAPNSPYKYKNYGMSAEGRASIKRSISEGKMKVSNIRSDKAAGIGQEGKSLKYKPKLSLLDRQTNQAIYMIKRFGIKTTNYFDDAVKMTFENLQDDMREAVKRDIIIQIESVKR